MRSLDNILSWLLFLAVIGVMVFGISANFLIIAQTLFSPVSVISSNSMSPSLQTDDAVIITSVDPGQLSVGDIVVFSDPENPQQNIIHRLVDLHEKEGSVYAVTKGDANPDVDPYLTSLDRIEGRVGITLPRAGIFLSFLKTTGGFIACVLCPLGLLMLYLLGKWYLVRTEPGKGFFARELLTRY